MSHSLGILGTKTKKQQKFKNIIQANEEYSSVISDRKEQLKLKGKKCERYTNNVVWY